MEDPESASPTRVAWASGHMVLAVPSPFFSKKGPNRWGIVWFLKGTMDEENGASALMVYFATPDVSRTWGAPGGGGGGAGGGH